MRWRSVGGVVCWVVLVTAASAQEGDLPDLIEALRSDDVETAVEATDKLEYLGPDAKGAIHALMEAVNRGPDELRHAALHALAAIGSEAVPAIVEVLQHEPATDDLRESAIWALGNMGSEAKDAVPALLQVLQQGPDQLREPALDALAEIGPHAKESIAAIVDVIERGPDGLRLPALSALAAIGPEAKTAVPVLVDTLQGGPDNLREMALHALAVIGPEAGDATPALVEALRHGSDDVCMAAMRTAAAIGPAAEATIPELLRRLPDRRWWVRRQAARALAAMGPGIAPRALDALRSENPDERAAAALILGKLGPNVEGTEAALIDALKNPNERVRTTAAAGLSGFSPRAIPALCAVLDDERTVAVAAAESLKTIRHTAEAAVPELTRALGTDVTPIILKSLEAYGVDARAAVPSIVRINRSDAPYDASQAALDALHGIGPAEPFALDELIKLLTSDDAQVRSTAANALGMMQSEALAAVPTLRKCLSDPSADVRVQAAKALWKVDGDTKRTIPIFEEAFGDEALDDQAARMLEEMGTAAVPALVRLLKHDRAKARWWAAASLKDIEPPPVEAIAPLNAALFDEDRHVRRMAGLALNGIGPVAAEAVPSLLAAAREGRLDRRTLAEAVEGIGPAAKEAIPFLLDALDDRDIITQRRVVTALCNIGRGQQELADVLIAAVKEKRLSEQTVFYRVGRLGPVAVKFIPLLEEALQIKDSNVRESATMGLGEFGALAQGSLPVLEAALNDDDLDVRFGAAHAIWRIDGETGPLAAVLQQGFLDLPGQDEEEWYGRPGAIKNVARMEAAAAPLVPVLAKIIGTHNGHYDRDLASLLGALGPQAPDAIPALEKMAANTQWWVRLPANEALARIRDEQEENR